MCHFPDTRSDNKFKAYPWQNFCASSNKFALDIRHKSTPIFPVQVITLVKEKANLK